MALRFVLDGTRGQVWYGQQVTFRTLPLKEATAAGPENVK
jgi:hypothetical protein